MAKKARQKKNSIDFDEHERRNAVEWDAAKRALANTRLWRIIIPVFCLTSCVAFAVSVQSMNAVRSIGTELGQRYSELAEEKPGKDAALEAVNEWLDSGVFTSGVDNLWWDNATKVGEDTETDGDGTHVAAEYWSHRLSFTDKSDGGTREVAQLVAIEDGVATPMGDPTVLPKGVNGTSSTGVYKPEDYNSLDQSESISNVLGSWAAAYVGSDANEFTVLVGDPESTHMYQPASVGRYDNVSINWMVECDGEGNPVPREERSDNPEYGAASLTIGYTPYLPENVDEDQKAELNVSARMNVTVLISNPMRGSAKVVDWGADGSLSTLEPYSQAVDKGALQQNGDTSGDDEDEDAGAASGDGGDGGDGEQPTEGEQPAEGGEEAQPAEPAPAQ